MNSRTATFLFVSPQREADNVYMKQREHNILFTQHNVRTLKTKRGARQTEWVVRYTTPRPRDNRRQQNKLRNEMNTHQHTHQQQQYQTAMRGRLLCWRV